MSEERVARPMPQLEAVVHDPPLAPLDADLMRATMRRMLQHMRQEGPPMPDPVDLGGLWGRPHMQYYTRYKRKIVTPTVIIEKRLQEWIPVLMAFKHADFPLPFEMTLLILINLMDEKYQCVICETKDLCANFYRTEGEDAYCTEVCFAERPIEQRHVNIWDLPEVYVGANDDDDGPPPLVPLYGSPPLVPFHGPDPLEESSEDEWEQERSQLMDVD